MHAVTAFAYNIPTIICAAAAFTLAFTGKEGWGWFIFGAVLLHTTVSYKRSGDDDKDEDASA